MSVYVPQELSFSETPLKWSNFEPGQDAAVDAVIETETIRRHGILASCLPGR